MALTQIQLAMLSDGILTADAAGRLKMADGFVNDAKISGVSAGKVSGQLADSNMSPGSVIQVVSAVMTGSQSTTSSSFVDISGLTVNITPSSTSSKILVLLNLNCIATSTQDIAYANLLRNGTVLTYNTTGALSTTYQGFGFGGVNTDGRPVSAISVNYLDSPASTSVLTYKSQFRRNVNSTAYINQWPLNGDVGTVSTITVMEIAG